MRCVIQGMFRFASIEKVGEDKKTDLHKIHIEQINRDGAPVIEVIKTFNSVEGKYKPGERYNFQCYESMRIWLDKKTGEKRARVDFMLEDEKK